MMNLLQNMLVKVIPLAQMGVLLVFKDGVVVEDVGEEDVDVDEEDVDEEDVDVEGDVEGVLVKELLLLLVMDQVYGLQSMTL